MDAGIVHQKTCKTVPSLPANFFPTARARRIRVGQVKNEPRPPDRRRPLISAWTIAFRGP